MATDRVDAVVIFGAAGDLAQLATFPAPSSTCIGCANCDGPPRLVRDTSSAAARK
jgi:hypothetical protein